MSHDRCVTMEFHVSRAARDRYGMDAPWFSLTGNVVLADLAQTRRLAGRMNAARDAAKNPGQTVQAGSLHAMGLIDEILHHVAALYREQRAMDAMTRALGWIEQQVGRRDLDAVLVRFTETFPPLAVYRGETGRDEYLAGATAGVSHREIVLEELMMLWLANANPAFAPYQELFDDSVMESTAYRSVIEALGAFFATQPGFGPDDQSLPDMLRSPAIAAPQSLTAQLEFIRTRWGALLGDFLKRLLLTLDVIREDERAFFMRFGARPSTSQRGDVSDFRALEHEREHFTPDRDWMPQVVLMAKSAYVWLDQLTRTYGRAIERLDQVPEEELARLARWGVTSLWLIGLWERSPGSRRIKQLCGNPEADASAYSLLDYRIAAALGGDAASDDLRARAWRHGIRLASDMVPNHMGIDSQWVMDHPDWFVSLDHSPYPSYSFNGPDLSWDDRVAIRIDDHYYDRSDAAVVFQRVDRGSGETRFVYHGNDGTSMPWNDTAQLDYLKPEVREAVIQTILHVARGFPVIRLDAAMTLAKKHYQRLWYPEPGGGGAIPSRAEHGLTRQDFDRAMPVEFWREVVDRVAAESPDTLLLAEAFWLMEGYFVRTLGMHRVYNSAFMNMLRDEENANYRSVIKSTLEFDADVLKRYVNFMSNPDERTAVDQFGTGDKYFGVCTLMATLPGLPMFGHGQIEGFSERYGMEFRRAGRQEIPDQGLIERHEREIFPLLHRRHVFADARNFRLFDFFTDEGRVNEDVFAFSNGSGLEHGLVLYHNRYASTAGWIRTSAAFAVKTGGDAKVTRQQSLGETLGLTRAGDRFCVFRDPVAGLDYVRSSREIHDRGLYAQLDAYRCQVFLGFREVSHDAQHPWAALAAELGGRGVPDITNELEALHLRPVVMPFRELVNEGAFRWLVDVRDRTHAAATRTTKASLSSKPNPATAPGTGKAAPPSVTAGVPASDPERDELSRSRNEVEDKFARLITAVCRREGTAFEPGSARDLARRTGEQLDRVMNSDLAGHEDDSLAPATVLGWLFARSAERIRAGASGAPLGLRTYRWDRELEATMDALGAGSREASRRVDLIEALVIHGDRFAEAAADASRVPAFLESLWSDDATRRLLRINLHENAWWFHRESFETLVRWLVSTGVLEGAGEAPSDESTRLLRRAGLAKLGAELIRSAAAAGYRVDRMAPGIAR